MRVVASITLAALVLASVLGGTAPFGRVLLSLGLSGLAATLFDDPGWRGVAHFRAGDMTRARDAFEEAKAHYNLGNAEAHRGAYAAALESYDVAMIQSDAEARANFDLVASFYGGLPIDPDAVGQFPERKKGPSAKSFVAEGDARAAGTGDDVTNANTMLGLAQLDSHGRLGVRRVFDGRFMVADERWLGQLPDVPGEYLNARIVHEAKLRAKLGLTPPVPDDPR